MGDSLTVVASLLARLDSEGTRREEVPNAVLYACVQQVAGFGDALAGERCTEWTRGGTHQGDIVGWSGDRRAVHLEVKGQAAQINWTKGSCRRAGCPGPQSQLAHMLEDGCPVIVIAAPTARAHKQMVYEDLAVRKAVQHMTWSATAAILAALPDEQVDLLPLMLEFAR